MISFDTETTGVDFFHGARPFFVTMCQEDGTQQFWEWDVDPLTREVEVPKGDLYEIYTSLSDGEIHTKVVGQNIKFDVHAMASVGCLGWKWEATHDTIIAGHLLANNKPHNLTDMAIQYLGRDISKYEKELENMVQKCRRYCRSNHPDWKIAKKDDGNMPSAKEKTWKYDTWLPRALARHQNRPANHPAWSVLRVYANADSAITLMLWQAMESELHRRGLWEIYLERMKLVPIAWGMEQRGVTLSQARLEELRVEYLRESYLASEKCYEIARNRGYELTLPKAGNNKSLTEFCFNHLDLPQLECTESGAPSLNKAAMEKYETRLDHETEQYQFVAALRDKRKRDTALQYMDGYERYMLNGVRKGWYVLHPNLNITGTDTLRKSSTNPNEQNISKQEGFNLRYCFGPMPGREWWSLDYENLELKIPAYEFNEKDLIYIFEHPEEPPYYGSYHLVVFDLLHPAEFKQYGKACKEKFRSTLYQWIKNGNFAIIYGAQEHKADETYHVRGAYAKVQKRFPAIAAGNAQVLAFANKHGYVETMPDKTVCPDRGYPLLVTRTDYGEVEPTKPFNYHISGTAMWCAAKASIRCQERLDEWKRDSGYDAWIVMDVHDELVFDLPKGGRNNLPKVRALQRLMQQSGDDIGVPLTVSYSYHPENWSVSAKF